MTKRSKFTPKKTRTFRSRFILYCWCADWYVGQGSREYRLLCRLKFWLWGEFGSNARWLEYYEQNYEKARRTRIYKRLTAKYIRPKVKTEDDYANELFQLLKQTCHAAVQFCNWTLNLEEKRSFPPHGLTGYCPTVYRDYDLGSDDDLAYICKDFVRMALHSRQHQKEEVSTEFITISDMENQ
jgi:hypothetical protein